MWNSILDALFDSLKTFAFVLLLNFIFSFILIDKKSNKLTVPIGAALGLLPQCGFSVVAAMRYNKKQITGGTLLAIFISTSDEAVSVLLSYPSKIILIFPLLILKFFIALFVGFLYDFLFSEEVKSQIDSSDEACIIECGCGHHQENEDFVHSHILHSILHSVKILLIVLIYNIIFSVIVYLIGEDTLSDFLKTNAYLSPLFCVIVGLIPNCASSILISKLFVSGNISFGACLGGLISNAGIGLSLIFTKDCRRYKIRILFALILSGLFFGYLCCFLMGF